MNLNLVPIYSITDISSELDDNSTFDVEQDPGIATDEEKFLKKEYDNRYNPYSLQLFKSKDLTIVFNTISLADKFDIAYVEDSSDMDVYNIKLTTEFSEAVNQGGAVGTETITYDYFFNFNKSVMADAVVAKTPVDGMVITTTKVKEVTEVNNTNTTDVEGTTTETKYEISSIISLVIITETTIDATTNQTIVKTTETTKETFNYKLFFNEKEIYN